MIALLLLGAPQCFAWRPDPSLDQSLLGPQAFPPSSQDWPTAHEKVSALHWPACQWIMGLTHTSQLSAVLSENPPLKAASSLRLLLNHPALPEALDQWRECLQGLGCGYQVLHDCEDLSDPRIAYAWSAHAHRHGLDTLPLRPQPRQRPTTTWCDRCGVPECERHLFDFLKR